MCVGKNVTAINPMSFQDQCVCAYIYVYIYIYIFFYTCVLILIHIYMWNANHSENFMQRCTPHLGNQKANDSMTTPQYNVFEPNLMLSGRAHVYPSIL